MQIGMQWHDADPKKTLDVKIEEAAEYYFAKYGRHPDACYVNPGVMSELQMMSGKIIVKPLRSILPNQLWIGVEADKPAETEHADRSWK